MHPAPGPTIRKPSPAAAAAAILSIFLFLPAGEARAFCGLIDAQAPSAPHARPRAAGREVLLTFDAAWSADGADAVLDTLRSEGVRATFFLAGRFIASNTRIVRRIAGEGHEAGNHTWSHGHLTRYGIDGTRTTLSGVTRSGLLHEMEATDREFLQVTGRHLAPIWRAPFGETNPEILGWTLRAGWTHVGWSEGMDTLDWVDDPASRLYHSPESTVRRILAELAARPDSRGPAVILMHLGSTRDPARRFSRALPTLIAGCRALGYRFVTFGESHLQAVAVAGP
ncbi:MAG TPA: polysaccharide deacetylase family protein [Candidatus Saccharimonadales bacterium]|nr:polysaccharide deacetylase family protein [Candidatus Saccharimonadales bacterium]